ncbi:Exodeoxyribonuclease VII small subunit [Clostridium amylolyticum]|uniref:Exodeoxyribonuclease 7 small subunit n=1 Tax=Clostridium amylolyticum TaxID=1121298 RepID=A0A1M6KH12_9CLOT|nr:exodeoxyribonuclease VII small subunit [Clostridium amylolyticum]SHJ58219.1 Exodeoxyribonuclease VII small subunit [Clostridium amylolyticum]
MPRKSESYNDLVNKLKAIIEKMEAGSLGLEDSMKLYEEGIMLTNKLYAMLKDSEAKIKILKGDSIEELEQ